MFKILLLVALSLTVTEIAAAPQSAPVAKDACALSEVIFGKFADGTQPRFASEPPRCSRTMHGALPALDKMVSTVITSPPSGARITSGKIHPNGISFTIVSTNMEFGHTDDPKTQYQSRGQVLNEKGLVKGHSHLVIQRLSNTESPPSPLEKDLVFFQSLGREHQPSSLDGETLRVVAKKELFTVPGIYRACTITTSSANTPVIMPIERRGPQDDCIRFNILA